MKMVVEYWNLALDGFAEWITAYKYLAPIIGFMLYGYAYRERYKGRKQREFWLYGLIVIALLMVPVTAIFFLIYQTRFYDYGWVWSMAPLTAILAWGVVELVFEQLTPETIIGGERLNGKRIVPIRLCALLAAFAVFFMLGNQGRLQQTSEEELQARESSEEILQYMEAQALLQNTILWGPKDIMQYMRSHNGEVTLFYGRDMWDAKSGAYDYEAYEDAEIACYNWIEMISGALNLYLVEVEQAPEEVHLALASEKFLQEAVARGVDAIILPTQITPWMERKMQLVAEEDGYCVSDVLIGEYTLWLFD